MSQSCATTRPVFIAKLKLNRIFAWLYKTFLFGSVFGIMLCVYILFYIFFLSSRCCVYIYIYFAGGLVPSGCLPLCVLRLCMQCMLHVQLHRIAYIYRFGCKFNSLAARCCCCCWSLNTDREIHLCGGTKSVKKVCEIYGVVVSLSEKKTTIQTASRCVERKQRILSRCIRTIDFYLTILLGTQFIFYWIY